jgi:hypothetical protein
MAKKITVRTRKITAEKVVTRKEQAAYQSDSADADRANLVFAIVMTIINDHPTTTVVKLMDLVESTATFWNDCASFSDENETIITAHVLPATATNGGE